MKQTNKTKVAKQIPFNQIRLPLKKEKKAHYECYHNAKSTNFLVTVLYRECKREIEFPTDLTHYTTMDSPLEHKEYMQFLLAKVSTKVIEIVSR